MNNWNFTGNIGKDCEVGSTSGGTKVCEFSVGVTVGYGQNKRTVWASCVMFGKKAEGKLPQYLIKGQQVAISGEIDLEKWEGGAKIKVFVSNVDLVGEAKAGKQQQNNQQAQQQAPQQNYQQAPQQQAPNQQAPNNDDFEDDLIPF